MKLAIITTHPIQYNAPLFQLIANSVSIESKVYYTWGEQAVKGKYDPDFGKVIEWDIPLLEAYKFEFLRNVSRQPGTHHSKGIINPDAIKQIESWSPDTILVYGWNFHSHLRILRHFKKKSVKIIFRGDSTLVDSEKWWKSVLKRIYLRWVYKNVDIAFYTGRNNRKYFERFGLKDNQLIHVPHAVENERFHASKIDKEILQDFKDRLGITEENFVLLFAGKLEKKKNPFFILELAKVLTDRKYRFLIVGNGNLEAELKANSKTDNRIIFVPFQNQSFMPYVYHTANIFILPSKGPGETWGLAANEAMAAGLPIILSDKVGGAPDLVVKGYNGLVFEKGEMNIVAGFVNTLSSDSSLYQRYKEGALEHVEKFTFTMFVDSLKKVVNG